MVFLRMRNSIIKIIWYNRVLITSIAILLILISLFVTTQGLLWYIINIFLYVTIVIILWLFYIKTKTKFGFIPNDKGKHQSKNIMIRKKIKRQILSFLLGIMLILGYILFMFATPYIKGSINEGYLHEVVNDIIEGKNTDQEKITALLGWFDRNSDHIYNSWFLNAEGKILLTFIPKHFYILIEMPYFGIRCPEDMDGKWILTSRFGACGEYSRIFMYMADAMGIDVKRVHAEGEDHVWNEVKIKGNWIPVDPTDVALPDKDGFKDYNFMEIKEGNVSYVWAEYLHNRTIDDLTYLYTNLTNVTLHCVDQNNNSVSNVTITITSHNLRRYPNKVTFIEGKSKPKTNETGSCVFQIGGGNYTFKANSDKFSGELKWIEFSDLHPYHDFSIILKKK